MQRAAKEASITRMGRRQKGAHICVFDSFSSSSLSHSLLKPSSSLLVQIVVFGYVCIYATTSWEVLLFSTIYFFPKFTAVVVVFRIKRRGFCTSLLTHTHVPRTVLYIHILATAMPYTVCLLLLFGYFVVARLYSNYFLSIGVCALMRMWLEKYKL